MPLLYANLKTFGVLPDGEPVPGYVDSPTKTYSISSDAFLVGEQWRNTEEEKDSILSGAYADALRECEVDCDVYRAVIEFLMLCFRGGHRDGQYRDIVGYLFDCDRKNVLKEFPKAFVVQDVRRRRTHYRIASGVFDNRGRKFLCNWCLSEKRAWAAAVSSIANRKWDRSA